MNIREYITKLQNLPDNKKKIILWTIVAITAGVMGFFWVREAIDVVSKLGENMQNVKLPEIDTSNMPALDLDKLGDQIKNNADQIK